MAETVSGLTKSAAKNLVQTNTIRPDVKASTGIGDRRQFGFLDLFEACAGGKLMAVPGGMPVVTVAQALDVLRFEAAMADVQPTPWGAFLNPATRDPSARFWLVWSPTIGVRILNHDALAAQLAASEAVVSVRLDTLLVHLEAETHDHAAADERGAGWAKGHGVSAQAAIEAAIERELTQAGMSDAQRQSVFTHLHTALAAVPRELRASAAFVRYVEMVDAIVAIARPGPHYAQWRRDVTAFMASWKRPKHRTGIDARFLEFVGARDAGRAAAEGRRI